MQTNAAQVCTAKKSKAGEQSRNDVFERRKPLDLKNCEYMNGTEFKDRQGYFEFFCTQAYEFLRAFRDECRAGWRELFKTPDTIKKQVQMALNFVRSIAEWAAWAQERNCPIAFIHKDFYPFQKCRI